MQYGEASSSSVLRIRLFPMFLSGTVFTWFTSLPPNSIHTWQELETKFHDYFYTGETELRLSHLTSVKQKANESVTEYIRRFRDTRNRCFGLIIFDKDLADLAHDGLLDIHKEKLEGHDFSDVSQVFRKLWLMKAELKIRSLIVLYMCLVLILTIQMMRIRMFMLLNLYGLLQVNSLLVILSSRFLKSGKRRVN